MKVANNLGPSLAGLDGATKSKDSDKLSKSLDSLGAKANASDGSSKVNLSEKAQHMQKAKEIASKVDIDEAKISRLQKLIDEGKYSVDASAVADRLVDDHLMFSEE